MNPDDFSSFRPKFSQSYSCKTLNLSRNKSKRSLYISLENDFTISEEFYSNVELDYTITKGIYMTVEVRYITVDADFTSVNIR